LFWIRPDRLSLALLGRGDAYQCGEPPS